MKKKLVLLSGLAMSLAPMAALAQVTGASPTSCNNIAPGNIQWMLCRIAEILGAVLPVLIALGVIYFVWGVITYVVAGDEEAKKKGRDRIIFGIIGLAVIVTVWGLVALLRNTFNLSNVQRIDFPTTPY